ncbi:MAG: flagellar protein FlgN [Pseudomonadota bacterium]
MAASSSATPQPGGPLGEEVNKLREFIALLKREQELLTRGDTDALLPLIESKTNLANALGALAQARENHLSRQGLPGSRAGMESWLASHGSPGMRQAWDTLLELAAEARSLNITNGKLIGLHMQHNQQAFAALMSATDRAMTYGPDGQQQAGLGGRILGKA